MADFDLQRARALLRKRNVFVGADLEYRASTDSTNDDVLALARLGAPHGTVLLADEQKKGRGRHGSTWFAPPADNLTFSVLLRPQLEAASSTALPLLAGLAVREAVSARVSAPVTIKWPNDVWVDGKKIAGILVESVMRGQAMHAFVVGVGINVSTTEFPLELASTATSLVLARATNVDKDELLADVLASLERRTADLVKRGFDGQLRELNRFDALLGRRVDVDGVRGIAAGIGQGGVLLVRGEHGVERCVAGSVIVQS